MDFLLTQHLDIGYAAGKKYIPVQRDLNLSAAKGELVALIGTNGCGKSTLLRSMAALQPIRKGVILVEGENIFEKTPKQRAKIISVVLTAHQAVASFTVKELIAIGRDPYSGWLGSLSAKDETAIANAIAMTALEGFEQRNIHTLSDGERQRVFIARALAQDTAIILLDEPTSHLDLSNRINILLLLKKLTEETGKTIIFSTHELETALQVADKIWLMHSQNGVDVGTPEDLVLNRAIDSAFCGEAFRFDRHTGQFKLENATSKVVTLSPQNNSTELSEWTRKALLRKGFSIQDTADIHIQIDENKKIWTVSSDSFTHQAQSIGELLRILQQKSALAIH